jgi:hypothetical protein
MCYKYLGDPQPVRGHGREVPMRMLFLMAAMLALVGPTSGFARSGMHSHSTGGSLGAPANPSVPPSLTPDSRLTGSAPLPPHHQATKADVATVTLKPNPEDVKVDHMIKSICRGC